MSAGCALAGDKLGTLTVVSAADHIDGGKAMRLKWDSENPPERINAVSVPVPVIPGKVYRVGGWFKADHDGKGPDHRRWRLAERAGALGEIQIISRFLRNGSTGHLKLKFRQRKKSFS